jgi:hypothetical protein
MACPPFPGLFWWSMISSENRYPLFGIMLGVEDQPWRGAIVAQSSGDATGIAVKSVFVRINQWFGMTQLIAAE